MRDDFYECSVAPEREKVQKTLYSVYNAIFIFTVAFFILTFFMWAAIGDTGFIFLFSLALISSVILFFLKRRLCLYFDYTYISGELRLIKVINGKTRRKFLIFDCKLISQIGKVGSDSFNKLKSSGNYKLKIATPNGLYAQKQLYYIAATVENEQLLIILECEEKLLSYIVANRGKTIIEKDYA